MLRDALAYFTVRTVQAALSCVDPGRPSSSLWFPSQSGPARRSDRVDTRAAALDPVVPRVFTPGHDISCWLCTNSVMALEVACSRFSRLEWVPKSQLQQPDLHHASRQLQYRRVVVVVDSIILSCSVPFAVPSTAHPQPTTSKKQIIDHN